MATSDDRPSTHRIDHERARASLRRTEQRVANARSRRALQQRLIAGCIALVAVLVALIWGALWARKNGPPAPPLVVTWPKPKLRQKLAGGSTVLVRPGQSFTIAVDNPQQWATQWHSTDVLSNGSSTVWSPGADSTLTVLCHPTASGWRRLVAWLWPRRTLTLAGKLVTATNFRYEVKPSRGGLWVYPLVFTHSHARWDERTLPQLMRTDWLFPPRLSNAMSRPLWTLEASFSGPPVPGDMGTYARLWSSHLDADLPRLCRAIARTYPRASIKFVIRQSDVKGRSDAGILRLAFDGKAQRGGWIKRAGETTATVIEWWADSPVTDQLSPAPPRGRR